MQIALNNVIARPNSRTKKADFVAHAAKWINAKGDEPVTEVAVRTLKTRLEMVQQYLAKAAIKYEDDDEYVHQLRVWSRRADAAIEMYRELMPEWRVAWIQKQLMRIRKATNDARDDDVFAERLAEDKTPDTDGLLKRVVEHRVEAQQEVLRIYERMTKRKGRFGRRVEKLLKRVRLRDKHRKSKPTYRAWAKGHLRPILDEFFEMAEGDLTDTERLHQFRIMGKNLRYAMELLSAAFCSQLRNKAYPPLETLQDQLGRVNDHVSPLIRIGHWIEENDDEERAKYLVEMLKSEQDQLKESCRSFAAWWSAERRDRLREVFEEVLGDSSAARKTV